jgi:DUF1680 family protein
MDSMIHRRKIRTGLSIALSLLVAGYARAQAANPVTRPGVNAVGDVFIPAPPESTHLSGRLGDKIDLCINNRLLSQDIEAVVAPYRIKRETGGPDWRCEYWGKWFTSLALADAYSSTDATRSIRDQAAKELLITAAPDGYLGTRQPAHRMEGWDVWGQKYALLGVLAYYDRTGDPAALQAARRHADVLISELGPGGKNIEDVGEWNGLPASSVLEPIVQLYQRTGDPKYLQFAQYIVDCWKKPSARLPNGMQLVNDALAGKAPAKMCAPKSYEMMSCFEGLCEMYRATGNHDFLDAPVKLCAGVNAEESNLVGCGTSNEVWFNGSKKQTGVIPKPMETCVTATWMKLQFQLLRLTGDERYADELEKNLYNGLLGAMMPDGRWWAYFSGMMGVRVPSYIQHADVGLSCCVVNGPRGLMITPFWAFMTSAEGPVISLYSPGTAHLPTPANNTVNLEISGDYPVTDSVEIAVNPSVDEEFTLLLRIPAWSEKTEVIAAGQPINVAPGTYAKIHRRWRAGDRISIRFDMRGRLLHAPDGNGQIAIARGPMVLSVDNRLAPAAAGQVLFNADDSSHIDLKTNPAAAATIGTWMAFDVPCTRDDQPATLTFCEYAAAGNAFSQRNIFRTWLPQPLDDAKVYNTGQTWRTLTHATVWTNPPSPPRRVADPRRDFALAINGSIARADSEYPQQDSVAAHAIDGIISGDNDFEIKRWHSSIDTPHPHWIQITLAKPSMIARAVIDPADPAGYPVRFEGQVQKPGETNWTRVFRCENNSSAQPYTADFPPIEAGAFRLVIEASANPKYPSAAQISEVELYAPDAAKGK